MSNKNIKMHAEMEGLNRVKKLLKTKKIKNNKMNLIVIRTNKTGNLCESAPCRHCTQRLFNDKDIKIHKIFFSRKDGSITSMYFEDWFNSDSCYTSSGWQNLCSRK